jgi:hypothetical protein
MIKKPPLDTDDFIHIYIIDYYSYNLDGNNARFVNYI